MPKGKTNQALTIMIPAEWRSLALFQDLEAMGHNLIDMPPEAIRSDIVMGVNCHIFTNEMLGQKGIITVALKAARKRKKGKKNEDSNG